MQASKRTVANTQTPPPPRSLPPRTGECVPCLRRSVHRLQSIPTLLWASMPARRMQSAVWWRGRPTSATVHQDRNQVPHGSRGHQQPRLLPQYGSSCTHTAAVEESIRSVSRNSHTHRIHEHIYPHIHTCIQSSIRTQICIHEHISNTQTSAYDVRTNQQYTHIH